MSGLVVIRRIPGEPDKRMTLDAAARDLAKRMGCTRDLARRNLGREYTTMQYPTLGVEYETLPKEDLPDDPAS